ncbi:MAG: class I SAM-dependent methyltransferase [Anaerolineae bacterium]|nr:class I SAM-dependent methyltransferase [Anaerolineae bacterium]
MNVREYNRSAWDRQVEQGNRWTVPVTGEEIAAARRGEWGILLTPSKPVPRAWFPPLVGADVLCLASGGGQQGPILAAAGARVTVFDNSPRQLEQDRIVAEREGLEIVTLEGDMADLSAFADAFFDLIFHPVSNTFVPQVRPVWREAYRVLRDGGLLLAGVTNPVVYLFDCDLAEQTGTLKVAHTLPYSDAESLSAAEKQKYAEEGSPLEFSHTLEDQIGGQLDAGFVLTGFYEDRFENEEWDVLGKYMDTYIATRALKAPGLAAR